MSNQNLILMLVILFFVLGCSFKCTGIKENFTMGKHHKRVRKSIYNCSECETECSAMHCQRNAGWCMEHLGIEYSNKCNKLKY